MPSVTLTWETMKDDRVCPVCHALEGYQWILQVGVDQLPNELTFGSTVAWDIGRGSQAHGHRGNCRCSLKVDLDLKDILAKLTAFYERLLIERGGETSAPTQTT
jgi:hypothetical protein